MISFIGKIYYFIKARAYVNETIIIYQVKEVLPARSVAKIYPATMDNLKDILVFQPKKYIEIFKDFLVRDDKGYFAYIDGKCVHRSWVKLNGQMVYPHWASPYKLKENEIYIHYCETASTARGHGVYPAVLNQIVNEHQDKDILISVNEKNAASKRGVAKVGFVERERVCVLIVCGIKRIIKVSSVL